MVSLTDSFTLGASGLVFRSESHFSMVSYLKKWSNKAENKICKPHSALVHKGF